MSKFKMRKVFDCQDMPDDIRREFFDYCEKGNDCYVNWTVFDERTLIGVKEGHSLPSYYDESDIETVKDEDIIHYHEEDGLIWCHDKSRHPVSAWLFENGAKIYEEVMVNHWW